MKKLTGDSLDEDLSVLDQDGEDMPIDHGLLVVVSQSEFTATKVGDVWRLRIGSEPEKGEGHGQPQEHP